MNLQAYTQSYLQHMQQLMAVAEELTTTGCNMYTHANFMFINNNFHQSLMNDFIVMENVRESKGLSTYCRLGDVYTVI